MESLFEASLAVIALVLFLLWRLKQSLDARQAELESTRRALRELQQAHQHEQARLTALTDVASDGLILLDADARVVLMNDAAETFFGAPSGAGRRLDELAWGYELQPLVARTLRFGETLGHTFVKGERSFSTRVRAVGAGAERGVLIGITETTELQRLGRVRRDFVANISHELRTPVATLQLLADTLSEETLQDHSFTLELLDKVRAQIDLLHQLTDELMDLVLIESGQAPIKLVETRVRELVNEAVEPLVPQLERKELTLSLHVPDDLLVLADAQGIRKVLGNLVHNAIKFTSPGGRIEIHAASRGDNVEFAVQDTGCGIGAQDLPRIFERFYKTERGRARDGGERHGTGLGLAIAKHMVEAHGGTIWAESVEGRGSTFYFTLPRAD
jgi:two-component system, OmpR family, phosphate regulon sensor histidine kinase PhoR